MDRGHGCEGDLPGPERADPPRPRPRRPISGMVCPNMLHPTRKGVQPESGSYPLLGPPLGQNAAPWNAPGRNRPGNRSALGAGEGAEPPGAPMRDAVSGAIICQQTKYTSGRNKQYPIIFKQFDTYQGLPQGYL